MQVKMRTNYASALGCISAGNIGELPDGEAKRLIAAGYAEPVKDAPIETASIDNKPETATTRLGKAKGKAKAGIANDGTPKPNGV